MWSCEFGLVVPMSRFLFCFGYQPDSLQDTDDEYTQCVWILAASESEALSWGREVAEAYVVAHWPSLPSWKASNFAHWIEHDDAQALRWARENPVPECRAGELPDWNSVPQRADAERYGRLSAHLSHNILKLARKTLLYLGLAMLSVRVFTPAAIPHRLLRGSASCASTSVLAQDVVGLNWNKFGREVRKAGYGGMTTNERLFAAGLLDEFDQAAHARNSTAMVALLERVGIASEGAKQIVAMILADPKHYGY